MKISFIASNALIDLALLVYANSLNGDLVYDDVRVITDNPDLDAKKTKITALFRNNFWGQPMSSPTALHQVCAGDLIPPPAERAC